MEVIFADSGAGSDSIAFDDLHVANSAEIIVIILILLLNNDILAQDAGFYVFYVFEEIGYFVVVNPAVGDDVSQFFVGVCVAEEEGVLVGEVKNFDEGVESVGAVLLGGWVAGALEFVADGEFEFGAMDVLKDEAGAPSDANQVKFL